MKKLVYHEFRVFPNEANKGRKYDELRNGKLYSIYNNDHPKSIDKMFESGEYSASMLFPSKDIFFYDFSIRDIALQPDDFMVSTEISSYFGFFVSPKVKNILSEYNLSVHKYYPVNIHFGGQTFEYFFLLISKENNGVNYTNSTFLERYNKSQKVMINQYNDLLELQTFEEDGSKYWTEKEVDEQIIIFDKEMDIYSVVTSANAFFYFSERLKQRLEEEGITGMEFYLEEDLEFYLNE